MSNVCQKIQAISQPWKVGVGVADPTYHETSSGSVRFKCNFFVESPLDVSVF